MVIDFIALGILVWCVVSGIRQGFFRILFKTFSFLTAVLLMVLLYNPLYHFASDTALFRSIEGNISQNVSNYVVEHMDESLSNVNDTINSFQFPTFLENLFKENAQKLHSTYEENTVGLITDMITGFSMRVGFGILLLIILVLLINILSQIFGLIAKLPVIHSANKLLGGAIGFLNGLIVLYVCAFLIMVLPFQIFMQIQTYMDGTFFQSFIYDNNILFRFLGLIDSKAPSGQTVVMVFQSVLTM